MNIRNNIKDELNELNSEINANANDTPYSVPEGYFEGLAAAVLAKIKGEGAVTASEEIAQLSPLLAGISKKTPYSVPEDYFNSNIEGLKAFTSDEESLVLSFIDKQMPYEVPAGYFANVPEQVFQKISDRTSRVVPLMRRKWMRLAVAAMITGIITISGIAYFNKSVDPATTDPVTAVQKASTEELNDFINSTAVDLPGDEKLQLTANNTPSKKEVKQLFDDVSDKELENFLDQVQLDDEEFDIN